MKTCSISGLRQNIYALFADVEDGEKLLVVRSGKVVGIVLPFTEDTDAMDEEFDPAFLADIRSRAKSTKGDFLSFNAFERSLTKKKRV